MKSLQDDDLRSMFQRLRAHESGKAPSFEQMCARPRTRRAPRTFLRVALTTLFIAAVVLVGVWRTGTNQVDATLVSSWRSPTDGLLKAPGSELLTSVPKIEMPKSNSFIY